MTPSAVEVASTERRSIVILERSSAREAAGMTPDHPLLTIAVVVIALERAEAA